MNKFFSAAVVASLAISSCSLVTPASANERGGPRCRPGDTYNPTTRKCDIGGTRRAAGPDSVELAFRADCDAHGGRVYTAAEWTGMGKSLPPGASLHCHADAHWGVDPK